MEPMLRRVIIMAPLALSLVLLVYLLMSGGGSTAHDQPPVSPAAANEPPPPSGGAGSLSAWLAQRQQPSGPSGVPAAGLIPPPAAPDEPAQEQGSSMLESMPEPLYVGSGPPSDEQLADAASRATRGATAEERVSGLAQLVSLGDARVVLDTLNQALADPDKRVRVSAVAAARRLAQYHGDANGDIRRWLTQAGYDNDVRVAEQAQEGANELAEMAGEEPPFARN